MKGFLVTFFGAILSFGANEAWGGGSDSVWDRANTAYINADYAAAVAGYDSIERSGNVSYRLYYNLGNAYFKQGNIGKSILSYNRALRLSPSDADVQYNLMIASSFVKTKIEGVPRFFVERWVVALRKGLSCDGWAAISLVALLISLGAMLLYLLSLKIVLRKVGFFGSLLFFGVFILSLTFSVYQRADLLESRDGVVIAESVAVKSSPEDSGKELFVLSEGNMVRVTGVLGHWSEIMVADGNKGWIRSDLLERI